MAKRIVLRGNSGCGKTTVAKALQRTFGRGTLHLSQDTVRREMLWVKDGAETAAIPLLIQLLRYGRENAEVTILEGILYADYYDRLFGAAIDLFGSDIHAYYYDVPFDETLVRHKTRAQSFEFGEPEMRRWWREKDFLRVLPETILTEDDRLDDVVARIHQDVSGA